MYSRLLIAYLPIVIQQNSSRLLTLLLLSLLFLCYKLGSLSWVIAPPSSNKQLRKVFVIGLSRTGTQSICEALNRLGWRTYHQPQALASTDASIIAHYVDRFDAFSDIAVVAAMRKLMKMYPEALFVLTTRDAATWARAWHRFISSTFMYYALRTQPTFEIMQRVYGSDWTELSSVEQWQQRFESHRRRVAALATDANVQLLVLDVSESSGDKWKKLCNALNVPAPISAFPHSRNVVFHSLVTQTTRQLCWLLKRIGYCSLFLALLFILLASGTFEYGQCARACRLTYANATSEAQNARRVTGAMLWSSWRFDECECWQLTNDFDDDDGDLEEEAEGFVSLGRAHRFYDYRPWNWPYESGTVCEYDDSSQTTRSHKLVADIKNASAVINCGLCGACSTFHDVEVYHRQRNYQTKLATICAIVRLTMGVNAGYVCTKLLIGFTPECSECWVENYACSTTHCFSTCMFEHGNPLTTDNNPEREDELNPCLRCDEYSCSHVFLRCAGANRRSSGVVTDIGRRMDQVCPHGYGRRIKD